MRQPGKKGNTQDMEVVVDLPTCCTLTTGTVEIHMDAGRTYFLRGFMKEGGGGDRFTIGMINTSTQERYFPIGLGQIGIPQNLGNEFEFVGAGRCRDVNGNQP